jgi:hypothetical protein
MARVGGMKEVKDIDPEAAAIANHLKPSVEEKTGKKFAVYEPLKYATQVPFCDPSQQNIKFLSACKWCKLFFQSKGWRR